MNSLPVNDCAVVKQFHHWLVYIIDKINVHSTAVNEQNQKLSANTVPLGKISVR